MIHINTVNINVQMPSDEPSTTSALGDALLHAMAESLFAEQESDEEMESEGVAQPPIDPPRMSSQQQCANAWMAVYRVLHEVCPGWLEGPGNSKENAVEAIRAMAKAR